MHAYQDERLAELLDEVVPRNRFVAERFRQAGLSRSDIRGVGDLRKLPTTTKEELLARQDLAPPYGDLFTYPRERYTRLHQTSGTQGKPLRWLDTPQSWDWMLECWRKMFAMAGVTATDRILFPFSFGPFLGFWTAFEAAGRMGALCLPAGGLSTQARVRMLLDHEATVVCCTPTYAMHLALAAQEQGIALQAGTPGFNVRAVIVAGEPGGSIPATRTRLEASWHARVFDHSGLTEVGPMAMECRENPSGLHVLEEDYIVEIVDPQTGEPTTIGEIGEMLVTNLGRVGGPVLRYRTRDLVRVDPNPCPCGRKLMRLQGGILGRTDDMIPIRGNNFYPGALENVVRRFAEVAEYRVEVDASSPLAELKIEVEPTTPQSAELAYRIAAAIRDELFFRAEVTLTPPGSLPRHEMKSRRVIRKR
ncbi:MAG: AMP-binding protein [Gemmataceae bacterium]|nr:AMP-binding protein [Gemmataceae bacterium]